MTSNEGSSQVRHGGRCFDPINMSSSMEPVLLSGVRISCYLSCLCGRQAHRCYLCIHVYWLDKIMISRVLLVKRGESAADIYHFITSALNRQTFCDPREHRGYIIYCFVSFCEQFQLRRPIVRIKYRLNLGRIPSTLKLYEGKKNCWDLTGGTFRLVPPLATCLSVSDNPEYCWAIWGVKFFHSVLI